jgi:hypothetical protein
MIGLILAIVVVAIVLSLFGRWEVAVPIAVVAAVLFGLFLRRLGRRPSAGKP